MTVVKTTLFADHVAELGEGPGYDPLSGNVWWFDILGQKLIEKNWDSGEIHVHALGMKASALAVIDRDRQLIVSEHGLFIRERAQHMMVRNGGPVDRTRGFVLHSDDYMVDSTMPVSEEVCLTATVDILRAIYGGRGPSRALMARGYSGWAPGQIGVELAENGWLTCDAPLDMLFDSDIEGKYSRLMLHMGIDMSRLVSDAGHA